MLMKGKVMTKWGVRAWSVFIEFVSIENTDYGR